ncbi:hypothetical protein D3C71_2084000 [compost metagenome]
MSLRAASEGNGSLIGTENIDRRQGRHAAGTQSLGDDQQALLAGAERAAGTRNVIAHIGSGYASRGRKGVCVCHINFPSCGEKR